MRLGETLAQRRFVVRVGREKHAGRLVRDCERQRKVVNLGNQAGGFLLVGAGPSAPSVETFRNIFGHV